MSRRYIYSAREYGHMLMCLGEARGNAALALRIYQTKYPTVQHPADPRVITAAFQRVLENRPIVPTAVGGGDSCGFAMEDEILSLVQRNPRLSTRGVVKLVRRRDGRRLSHGHVHKVLRRNKMRPYNIHKVQALFPGDCNRRREYCQWLLDQQQQIPGFIQHVIWTDESTFTRNGMWNRKNVHMWSQQNPHAFQATGHQVRWSVNVWAGIINDKILGPIFLPLRLNGQGYTNFINNELHDMLDELPLAQYRRSWFQHDGAPPHVVLSVRESLTRIFEDRWIGRLGPHAWPPRSPDLTPLDFFLWGYVKEKVFIRECTSADEMRGRIVEVFDKLRADCIEDPTLMSRLHEETERRARLCLQLNGNHFEPHLLRLRRS